jgi:hypothetical protein
MARRSQILEIKPKLQCAQPTVRIDIGAIFLYDSHNFANHRLVQIIRLTQFVLNQ